MTYLKIIEGKRQAVLEVEVGDRNGAAHAGDNTRNAVKIVNATGVRESKCFKLP